MRVCTRILNALAVIAALLPLTALAGPTTPTTIFYTTTTTTDRPTVQRWTQSPSGAWGWSAAIAVPALGSTIDWIRPANCPGRDELGVLTIARDRSVRLSQVRAGVYTSIGAVTTDAATSVTRSADAAYEQHSSRLFIAYSKRGQTNIFYRTAAPGGNGGNLALGAEASVSLGLAENALWVLTIPRVLSDDILVLAADSTRLAGAVWNGASFTRITTFETSLAPRFEPFSGIWTSDGTGLVTWGRDSTARVIFATLAPNATAWRSAQNGPLTSGVPTRFSLAANPTLGNSTVVMLVADTSKTLTGAVYASDSFSFPTTLQTGLVSSAEHRFDVAYTRDASVCIALWHRAGQNALRQSRINGTTFGTSTTGPDMTSETTAVSLVPGPGMSELTVAALRRGTVTYADYLVYSLNNSVPTSGPVINGLSGAKVGGVGLPSQPSGTMGQTNVAVGGNTTLAPGSYQDLSAGNNAVLNVSAGTYRFRSLTANNNFTINANTAAGPVYLNFYNGSVSVKNNFTINNTGGNPVTMNITTGSFAAMNNAAVEASIVAFNSNISFGNNTSVDGSLFANGDVAIGSGTVNPPFVASFTPTAARLSVARFTAGAFTAPQTLTSSLLGYTDRGPAALSPLVSASGLRLTRWRELTADEFMTPTSP